MDVVLLISLPNISKWNTYNLFVKNDMFHGCYSLISLPNLSNWYIKEDEKMTDECLNCLKEN